MKQLFSEHPEIGKKMGDSRRGKKRPPEVGAKISAVKRLRNAMRKMVKN